MAVNVLQQTVLVHRGEDAVVPVSVQGDSPYTAAATWEVTVFNTKTGATELTLTMADGVTVTDPAAGPDSFTLTQARLAALAATLHGWSMWATEDGQRQRVGGGILNVVIAGTPA